MCCTRRLLPDDAYTTDMNTALVVAAPGVLGNDSDEDNDPLTVDTTPVTAPADGLLALNADGSFTYTPGGGFVGTDTFEYRIDDGAGGADTALVTIVVDDGVVTDGLYLTSSGSGTEFVFGSTPEPNVAPVPDYDGDGNPGFTIESSGGDPNESDPAKYQLWTLQPATPLALNGPVRLELWSTVASFNNDDDADLDLALFECAADGTDCNLLIEYHEHVDEWNREVSDWVFRTFDLGAIDLTVLPTRRLEMKLMFGHVDVWVAMAGENPGEASRLLLTEANATPAAANDFPTLGEDDGATPIDVLSNDIDTNLDPASVSVTGGAGAARTGVPNPVTGEIPYTAAGSFEYLAAAASEIESFTYEVCDTNATCDSATVQVTITGVNDAPVAVDDGPGSGFEPDADTTFTTDKVTDNDSDVDVGDSFSVVLWDAVTAGGALVTDGGGGKADYDPNGQFDYLAEGETATDTFSYTIEDGSGAQATATVTVEITGVNEDPVVNDQSFTVDENSAPTDIVGTVAASDVDASAIRWTTPSPAPTPGSPSTRSRAPSSVGSVVLDFETLPLSYTITVEATDDSPSAGTDDAVITITVTDVRELPTANDNGPGAGFATDQDTAFTTANVLGNDVDPDGDPMTVVLDTTGAGGLVVNNGDGTFDYDPNGAFESLPAAATATDTFTYTLAGQRWKQRHGHGDDSRSPASTTRRSPAMIPMVATRRADFDAVSGFQHFIPAAPCSTTTPIPIPETPALRCRWPPRRPPTAPTSVTPRVHLSVGLFGFAGSDTFAYRIADAAGATDTGTVTVAPGVRYIAAPDAGSIRINEVLYAETGSKRRVHRAVQRLG